MQLVTNPFIRSLMLFFFVSLVIDLASRVWLNPKKNLVPDPISEKNTKINVEDKVDDSEFDIVEGSFLGNKDKLYTVYINYCEGCGYHNMFQKTKSELEKYRNVFVESKIVPKSFISKTVKQTFTYFQYGTIAFITCKFYKFII